ncbi:MAG: nucleoside diphosphate kinase regulator [Planctomycetaceae bacterium]
MANRRQIIVTEEDHERLENLFASELAAVFSDKPYLQSLRGELDIAKIVGPEDVPSNVVTMNSTVRLRQTRSKEVETYTLVYPEDADIARGKLSVLAPIGTAILGYRVGDRVEWQVPSGVIRFKIEELVFQPERDGVVA